MSRIELTKLGVTTTQKQFSDLFYNEDQFNECVAIYDSHEQKDDLLQKLRALDDDFAGVLFGHEDQDREYFEIHSMWNQIEDKDDIKWKIIQVFEETPELNAFITKYRRRVEE